VTLAGFLASVALVAWLSPLASAGWRVVLRLLLATGAFAVSRSLLDALAVEAALALCDGFRNPSSLAFKETR